jgi:serine O-acetyltransferase
MRLWLRRLRYRFGIDVPASTRVGPGLYINHPGGIVVHSEAVIGRNCNLSHDVTVGEANRGPRKGFAVIGDGVFLGPGAKVIGRVHIGDDVAVGANAVVTSDVPGGSVVAGVPARVISHAGAVGYINHTDY